MFIFTRSETLKRYLGSINGKISFVPTMGALHEGHLSLIDLGKARAEIVVCSIFVNPTQFNDAGDLEKYPRTVSSDIRKLIDRGCDVLFLPPVEEVYPPELDTTVDLDLEGLDRPMEGAHRPGHFDGVVQVVKRLLDLVNPDFLIMGQKDYQQYRIVEMMIEKLDLPCQIVMGKTLREKSGLAMSSRNRRLSAEEKAKATVLFKTLNSVVESYGSQPINQLVDQSMGKIRSEGLDPEYFELVDGKTLLPLSEDVKPERVVVCVAANLGAVRLIDNMIVLEQ